MAISRLFVEIDGDTSKLNKSLQEAMKSAKEAGVQITKAGQSMIAKFDEALNPTRKLGEQIKLLEVAGKSGADIWRVYGTQIQSATASTRAMGQAVDPTVRKMIEANAVAVQGRSVFSKMADSLSATAKGFIGAGIAIAASRITHGIIEISKESTKMAMDAIESENLFAVSMGNMTDAAVEWSRDLSKALGLNQYELRKNIGTFNVMFDAMGIGADKAYEMSAALTELAYDFASFYNLKPEEAFTKLRAGITGETEPLKRLGILVDEATVKAYAYKSGIADVGDELTQQEKVLARYGAIMEQTSKAQGDLARTLESPANALRVMQSRFDELKVTIGMAFIPAMQGASQVINDFVSAIGVGGSGLGYLAKALAYPVKHFNELNLQMAQAARNFYMLKTIVDKVRGASDEAKKETFDQLQKTLDLIDKFAKRGEDLDKWVEGVGKFDYAAARAGIVAQDLSEKVGDTSKEFEKAAKAAKEYGSSLESIWRDTEQMLSISPSDSKKTTDAALKGLEDGLKAYKDIGEILNKEVVTAEKERLEIQKAIIEATLPQSEAQRKQFAEEKIHLDYAIKAEELRAKYVALRAQIEAKIAAIDPADPLKADAIEALGRLADAEKQALDNLTKMEGLDVIKQHNSEYTKMIESVRQGAGEVFDAIVSRGKGAFQTLQDWIEGVFLSQLKRIFQNFVTSLSSGNFSLSSILGGAGGGSTGTGGAGSWGNLLGGLGSLSAGMILPASISAAMSSNNYVQGAGIAGASMSGIAAIGSLAYTGGLGGTGALLGGLMTNPITAAAAGLLVAAPALLDWISGKDTYEAGTKEIPRDYGGVSASEDEIKAWLNSLGISESQAYHYRKDIFSSPKALAEFIGPLAEQQGKMDEFLESLENIGTSWGTFNFRDAFELGDAVGDWSQLNEEFEKAFGDSVSDSLGEKLKVAGQGTESLLDSFAKLRETLKSSIVPLVDTMFNKFLDTGEITANLRDKIEGLGGDLAKFEQVSSIAKLNTYFGEMAAHFRETGEILPDLRKMIQDYGGDLAAIDTAAGLPTLKQSLGFIQTLSSGLSSLAQQFDPINQLLSGQWNTSVMTALSSAGLDPAKFQNISEMIKAQSGWSELSQNALGGGRISNDLLSVLRKYGGEAGSLAVSRYGEGFNTVTASLLEATKAAMDSAYNEELTAALGYLSEVGAETTSEIATLTQVVENELSVVSDNLTLALNEAKEAVVGAINNIILALYRDPELEDRINYMNPSAVSGGGVTVSPVQSATTPQIVISGTIYGFDDFAEKVRQAGITLAGLGYI